MTALKGAAVRIAAAESLEGSTAAGCCCCCCCWGAYVAAGTAPVGAEGVYGCWSCPCSCCGCSICCCCCWYICCCGGGCTAPAARFTGVTTTPVSGRFAGTTTFTGCGCNPPGTWLGCSKVGCNAAACICPWAPGMSSCCCCCCICGCSGCCCFGDSTCSRGADATKSSGFWFEGW
jgi:hypothetical protein